MQPSFHYTSESKEKVVQVVEDLGNGRYSTKTFVDGELLGEYRNYYLPAEDVLRLYEQQKELFKTSC